MAKKSMKAAATAGSMVFDQIASGNVQNAESAIDAKDVQNAQGAKRGRPPKSEKPLERLNLKIPAEIKEYLTIAAAKASIENRRSISLTQYLCDLVEADMEKHKDD